MSDALSSTHAWISPASFQMDAPYGARTCSNCHACTCHDEAASLAPCVAAEAKR